MRAPVRVPRGLDALNAEAARRPLRPQVDSFLFLRHGETDGNRLHFYQGAEQPLNAAGEAQAREAAGILAGEPVKRIVASDMRRAWQTATIVAAAVGATPVPSTGLRERWFGDFVGTSTADFDWSRHPPNGEDLGDFVARARGALAAALAGSGRTLVVAHGGVLYVALAALGIPFEATLATNALPLRFVAEAGVWRASPLRTLNVSGVGVGSLS